MSGDVPDHGVSDAPSDLGILTVNNLIGVGFVALIVLHVLGPATCRSSASARCKS
jgi:hypothetical protein